MTDMSRAAGADWTLEMPCPTPACTGTAQPGIISPSYLRGSWLKMVTSPRGSHSAVTSTIPAHGAGKAQPAGALTRLRALRGAKRSAATFMRYFFKSHSRLSQSASGLTILCCAVGFCCVAGLERFEPTKMHHKQHFVAIECCCARDRAKYSRQCAHGVVPSGRQDHKLGRAT